MPVVTATSQQPSRPAEGPEGHELPDVPEQVTEPSMGAVSVHSKLVGMEHAMSPVLMLASSPASTAASLFSAVLSSPTPSPVCPPPATYGGQSTERHAATPG